MASEINNTSNLSPFVNYKVPEFVRIDHPSFVAFLNAYYEWMETQGSTLRNPLEIKNVRDIDTTFDDFTKSFKSQYLLDFPETLAFNTKTGIPVDVSVLIKHIKQFYKAKGTEKTYEFLFRILYDTNVEFYYPKVDILRTSDGKWIQKFSIRVPGSSGTSVFQSLARKVTQRNASGSIIASAIVTDVSKYQLGSFPIVEIFLSNINGSFSTSYALNYETDSGSFSEPFIYSAVTAIAITSGGSGYRIGDSVVFTNASGDLGQSARAKVSSVSSTGKILKISIQDFGVNYKQVPTITITSEKGTGFVGTCSIGALCEADGYYANNDGRLSTNKVLQDNHYYQNYSYVLKTEVVFDRYKDTLKRLIHPAGLGFFGEILIKRSAKSDLSAFSTLSAYEVPLIGHYLPYTNNTFDNLAKWFTPNGVTSGYDPTTHDSLIVTSSSGNPITVGKVFVPGISGSIMKQTGFRGADPFWIVYRHPNTRITGNNIARIEYDLTGLYPGTVGIGKSDFLLGSTGATSWSEWTMTGASERTAWADGFTGGFKYAILKYSRGTEFRKITMRSFFNMPIGNDFDSRNIGGVGETHESGPHYSPLI